MVQHFDWQLQKKIRVLVASNDALLSERVWAFLEQGGDTRPVGAATSGRECLEMLKNHAPDVLLIAQGLPGEDVLDICREAVHIHPRIASVILAQHPYYSSPDYLHGALDMGVCDVLQVETPYADLRFQTVIDSVTQAYNLIQERISGVGGGIGRVVSFFSLKGGVGTSTLAANLALLLSMHEDHHRVMIADFNWNFGSLDALVGHTVTQSVLDLIPVLDGISRTDLESIAPPINTDLRLLPAPLDLERVEFIRDLLARDALEDDRATLIDDLLMTIRKGQAVHVSTDKVDYLEILLKKEKVRQILAVLARRTIQSLRRNYHYIVVDASAHLDDVTTTTLELADLVVLVCTPDVPAIRATRAAMTLLGELGVSSENIVYAVNRTSRHSEISISDVRNLFTGYEMIGEIPANYRALQPFINSGSFVAQAGATSSLARGLYQMTANITARTPVNRAA